MAHGKASALAITPCRPGNRRKQRFGFNSADPLERVFQRPLFRGDLQRWIRMLQCASAANAEMRTARRHARCAGFVDRNDAGNLVGGLLLERLDADLFARKRALDEYRLAFNARDAAAFLIERLDRDGRAHHAHAKTCNFTLRLVSFPLRKCRIASCAFFRSTHRLNGCPSRQATVRRGPRISSAQGPQTRSAFCLRSTPCWPMPDGGLRTSMASRSAQVPAHSPACGSPAASHRDCRSARSCRSFPFRRCSRWRRKRGAIAELRGYLPVSTRGCAKSISRFTFARTVAGMLCASLP